MVRPIGVLLAGGASTRMGTDKADVEVAGRPMAAWVLDALRSVCDRVVVAGRPDGLLGIAGLSDPVAERRGPLAGLVAALEHGGSAPVLLVATDQPWVRAETLRQLSDQLGDLPLVPTDRGERAKRRVRSIRRRFSPWPSTSSSPVDRFRAFSTALPSTRWTKTCGAAGVRMADRGSRSTRQP